MPPDRVSVADQAEAFVRVVALMEAVRETVRQFWAEELSPAAAVAQVAQFGREAERVVLEAGLE